MARQYQELRYKMGPKRQARIQRRVARAGLKLALSDFWQKGVDLLRTILHTIRVHIGLKG